ncbi:hypothetical protein [Actinomadura rubteroloni]|uniref:hypothetical protein n=1 Tax=Actinomadura rubteroloni TaxID=1926885 RepID=UPI000CD9C058|nr:hypothetical protein [Actinomadura rubteroloni]
MPVDAWVQDADAISVARLDEVGGHPRPSGVGVSYVEQEFHALAEEQEWSWPAEGEHQARPFQMRAHGLEQAADAAGLLLLESAATVRQATADYRHAFQTLSPHTRREPGAKWRYWLCWLVLVLGDTAGVWSAAVTGGDIVYIAFGQALASGVAAGCAGLVGAELKYLRMARGRRRDPDTLTADEQRYRRLFAPTDEGTGVVRLVGLLSLLVVVLVAAGVFTLRGSIEGGAAGATFGMLAAASALGSLLLGYASADEVADLIAGAAKRAHRAEKRHRTLAAAAPLRERAEAAEAARSLRVEHELRGRAAGKRVEALGWRVLRRNPHVFGHGYPAGETSGIIGRRTRRGGAA